MRPVVNRRRRYASGRKEVGAASVECVDEAWLARVHGRASDRGQVPGLYKEIEVHEAESGMEPAQLFNGEKAVAVDCLREDERVALGREC